ncbi:hypothetical protein EHW97_01075 [Aeromicrobium camelliae]|uniref:Uncharacterized protein n=1 Tax=Aeromicrobium camelliae TaxID=1538144 RepID=A0A3N6WRN2_9ACTN|nr:hypothetical protein [Aeromicrobium camelliae]RQN10116.1 hypothetical protein EHW97_01075 [Aeromicrobium camelliae]
MSTRERHATGAEPGGAADAPQQGAPPRDDRRSWWMFSAILAVIAAAGTHITVAWSARSPSFPFDEITYLQMARLIAGDPPAGPVDSGGYYPGWSAVIAPVWWVTQDPLTVYRASIAIAVVLAVLTIWPLSTLVRRWGLTWPQAVTVAAVVMCLPSRALQSDYVLSESLLMLLVVCAVLAGMRLWERPSVARALLLSTVVALAYLTHARVLPFVLAAGIWLLFFFRRSWLPALCGLVSLAGLSWGVGELATALNDRLVEGAFAQTEGFTQNLETTTAGLLAVAGSGQVWYQLVASFGVVALGAIAVVVGVARDLRHWMVGPAGLVLGVVLAMVLLSILAWSGEANLYLNEWRRLDAWLYGRYADPFTAVVVAIGLAVIVRGASWKVLVSSAVAAAGVLAVVLVKVAPLAPTWGFITPAHIPGVMPWWWLLPDEPFAPGLLPSFTNENRFWLVASLSVVVGLGLAMVLRRRPLAFMAIFAVAAVTASVVANEASGGFQAREGGQPGMVQTLQEVERVAGTPIDEVDFDRECRVPGNLSPEAQNLLGFWLSPRDFEVVWPSKEDFTADLVVSCQEWPEAEALGARAVRGGRDYGSQLWVLPGELQDRLDRAGLLTAPTN